MGVILQAHAQGTELFLTNSANTNGRWTVWHDASYEFRLVTPVKNLFDLSPAFMVGRVNNDHVIGVYSPSMGGTGGIYNMDGAPMPLDAGFNLLESVPWIHFVHFATTLINPNISGKSTYLDSPITNGNPNALVFLTPNFDPEGFIGNTNNHSTAVWFDYSRQKWAIYNQDGAPMRTGAEFNVVVQPSNGASVFWPDAFTSVQSTWFTHHVSLTHVTNLTYLDNPSTNGRSNAHVFVTSNWNPGGFGGVTNRHNFGVVYDHSAGKWAIFTQDGLAHVLGAGFNVLVIETIDHRF